MFIINHVRPEDATGRVAEAYSVLPPQVPVPDPLILMSASPELVYLQSGVIRHYMNHEKLDMGLLAMIRYIVANEFNYPYCINLNAGILKLAGGMSDSELDSLKTDPSTAPLEEAQKALLLFAVKVAKAPDEIRKTDVDNLRELGWNDQDIFDASYHAASMVSASILFKAFSEKK